MHVDSVNKNVFLKENYRQQQTKLMDAERVGENVRVTRKSVEAADKANANRRRQRKRAATGKAVETADQANAHTLTFKMYVIHLIF